MNKRPIHYEPHPVSPERKAELIGQGFRIVDAKFAPGAPAKPAPEAPVEPVGTEPEAAQFTESAWDRVAAVVKPRGKPGRKPKA